MTIFHWAISVYEYAPNWRIPNFIIDPAIEIRDYALMFDGIVPVEAIFIALSWIVFFEFSLWTIKAILTVFNFMRGSGELKF